MSSIVQTFQKRSQTLPVSSSSHPNHDDQEKQQEGILRRRLSSLYSERIEPISVSVSPAATWALRRTKSVSAMGERAGASVREWWARSWAWILTRKPTFAQDLEMNEEETKALGPHTRGTWRHVIFKVRSELRRLVRSPDRVGLPQTCRYDSYNYARNFDDGVTTRLVS